LIIPFAAGWENRPRTFFSAVEKNFSALLAHLRVLAGPRRSLSTLPSLLQNNSQPTHALASFVLCRILEIARTGGAAPTGGAKVPQENAGAAKLHR